MIRRTLLMSSYFPPGGGGGERYIETLVRTLSTDRMIIVVPPRAGEVIFDSTLSSRVIRKDLLTGFLRWLRSWPWLRALCIRERITYILFGNYSALVTLGRIAKYFLGVPYSMIIHGTDFLAYNRQWHRRLMLRWNCSGADFIFVNSSYSRRLLTDHGTPRSKIILASPGVPSHPQMTDSARIEFRQRFHISGSPILITVGRLVDRKGHRTVISALPHLLNNRPNITYMIIGDGPLKKELQQLAKDLHVDGHVVFTGRVSDEDVRTAYSLGDVFVLLGSQSDYDVEGFGIVYAEAMSAGLPVVARRCGGITDVVREQETGIVLDEVSPELVASTLENLFSKPDVAKQLARTGEKLVSSTFTPERQAAPFRIALADVSLRTNEHDSVDVIIPVWNTWQALHSTLRSLACQTFKNFNVTVVDDGSSVSAGDALRSDFPFVQFIRQDHAGAPKARNLGFRNTVGDYVLFCDSDVVLSPRILERMVAFLKQHRDASYAYCNFRFGWRTFDVFDFQPERLKSSNFISTVSLIRRRDFPGFDETIQRLQDWDLWLTMLSQGKTGVWVPERLFNARGMRGYSSGIGPPPAVAVHRIRSKHHLDP